MTKLWIIAQRIKCALGFHVPAHLIGMGYFCQNCAKEVTKQDWQKYFGRQ